MKADADCLPCIIRQVLGVARRVTDDPWLHRRVVAETMVCLAGTDVDRTPPEITHDALRVARKTLGVTDPFEEERVRYDQEGLGLEAALRDRVEASEEPLREALRLAVAANGLDIVPLRASASLREMLSGPVTLAVDHSVELVRELESARSVLYVLDNAGELVVDRLVLERLEGKEITAVVRKGPGMLDATRFDAEGTGLADRWKVLQTGTEVPGAPLDLCSNDFRDLYRTADVVVAKGAANFETMGEGDRVCYFALTVKCGVVARGLGIAEGDRVLLRRE